MKHKTVILVSLSYWLFAHSLETPEWVDNGKHKTFQVQGEVCQAAQVGQRQRNHSLYWGSHSRGTYHKPLKACEGFERISITEVEMNCTWTAAWRVLGQHLRHHIERGEYGCENFVSYCSQTLNRWFQFIDNFCVCQCLFCGHIIWEFAAKQKNRHLTKLNTFENNILYFFFP